MPTTQPDSPHAPTTPTNIEQAPAEPPREPASHARYLARTARVRTEFAGVQLQEAVEFARRAHELAMEAEASLDAAATITEAVADTSTALDAARRRADAYGLTEAEFDAADAEAERIAAELRARDAEHTELLATFHDAHDAAALAREQADWQLRVAQAASLDAIAHALTGLALVETGAVIPPRRHWSAAWHEGRES